MTWICDQMRTIHSVGAQADRRACAATAVFEFLCSFSAWLLRVGCVSFATVLIYAFRTINAGFVASLSSACQFSVVCERLLSFLSDVFMEARC